jgi:hypothetical protein
MAEVRAHLIETVDMKAPNSVPVARLVAANAERLPPLCSDHKEVSLVAISLVQACGAPSPYLSQPGSITAVDWVEIAAHSDATTQAAGPPKTHC